MNAISGIVLKGGLAVLVASSALAMSTNANAATQRAHYVTATAVCSGPLPSYDASLRRSPLGVRNVGTASVFISCSFPADFASDLTSPDAFLEVLFHNFGAVGEMAVSCTSTMGNRYQGSIAEAGVFTQIGDSDGYVELPYNKVGSWGSHNFSCVLPPGYEMGTLLVGEGSVEDDL
jgi:hypothetical protein